MKTEILKEIVKIAKDQGVAELKVVSKDFKVFVSFVAGSAPVVHHTPVVHHASAPVAAAPVVAAAKAADSFHAVKSPFVGTFYASPSPGKPVYVKVGDKVKAGQTLCVLEAMKIMNEIDADVAGEIVEICVDNESLVEFGQPLFKIRPN